jgi:hypothetical protein
MKLVRIICHASSTSLRWGKGGKVPRIGKSFPNPIDNAEPKLKQFLLMRAAMQLSLLSQGGLACLGVYFARKKIAGLSEEIPPL